MNLENPINYFFIGQSAIILVNKIYYLRNYDDSVKELVDTYFLNKYKENDTQERHNEKAEGQDTNSRKLSRKMVPYIAKNKNKIK